MSGPAVDITTRQFRSLLLEAAEGLPVTLKLYAPFAQARHQTARTALAERYLDAEKLWASDLDGIIVTGTEPKAASLTDEPCWPFLKRLVEWSEDHVVSTIWSCLATQAAVFYLDGIARQPFKTKLSGLFDCQTRQDHPLLRGFPSHWTTPHSRYNDLPESELVARGYRILTRSDAAGADIFLKTRRCRHLFLQGHMEYDSDVLSREYRRDVRRFLLGDCDRYPELPTGYFPASAAAAFAEFRERAVTAPRPGLLSDFPRNVEPLSHAAPWRPVATTFYRNWLADLARRTGRAGRSERLTEAPAILRHDPDVSEAV
jgi:homoserine O-succinyltransferase